MKILPINNITYGKRTNADKVQNLFKPGKLYNKQEAINWLLDTLNLTNEQIAEDEKEIAILEKQVPKNTKKLFELKFDLAVLEMRKQDITDKLTYMKDAPEDEKMMVRLEIMG